MTPPDGFPLSPLDTASGTASNRASDALGDSRVLVPCAAPFADAVRRLARARGVGVSDLLAAALLLVPDRLPDPGPPGPDERPGWLDVRRVSGLGDGAIRRALAAALALADPAWRLEPAGALARLESRVETLDYRNKALANALERVSFRPLDGKVTEVREAAQLFGFVNEWCFDEHRVVKRFRELAPVYHPDTGVVACRDRMAQLIDARNLLIRHVRTAYNAGPRAPERG